MTKAQKNEFSNLNRSSIALQITGAVILVASGLFDLFFTMFSTVRPGDGYSGTFLADMSATGVASLFGVSIMSLGVYFWLSDRVQNDRLAASAPFMALFSATALLFCVDFALWRPSQINGPALLMAGAIALFWILARFAVLSRSNNLKRAASIAFVVQELSMIMWLVFSLSYWPRQLLLMLRPSYALGIYPWLFSFVALGVISLRVRFDSEMKVPITNVALAAALFIIFVLIGADAFVGNNATQNVTLRPEAERSTFNVPPKKNANQHWVEYYMQNDQQYADDEITVRAVSDDGRETRSVLISSPISEEHPTFQSKISPDGSQFVTRTSDKSTLTINDFTGASRKVGFIDKWMQPGSQQLWSADGSMLVTTGHSFKSGIDARLRESIVVVDPRTAKETVTINIGTADDKFPRTPVYMCWSRGQRTLFYITSSKNSEFRLYSLSLTDGKFKPRQLASGWKMIIDLLQPDDKTLFCRNKFPGYRGDDRSREIWVKVDQKSGKTSSLRVAVSDLWRGNGLPSPDLRFVILLGDYENAAMLLDRQRLTSIKVENDAAVTESINVLGWSDDGKQVVLAFEETDLYGINGRTNIYVVNVKGQFKHLVTLTGTGQNSAVYKSLYSMPNLDLGRPPIL